jgi:hypothetical protein
MPRWSGPILRRVGLLIEIGCILAFLAWGNAGRTVAGISVRDLLRAGALAGCVLWAVGTALIFRSARQMRR